MRKDDKRRIAYEILIFLGTMLLLFLVLRMWPIVLLFILAIFAAALRMLFLSTKKVEVIPPVAPKPPAREPAPPQTEQDMLKYAYALVQRRITSDVEAQYPNARWVWETPNAQRSIIDGEPVAILLNGAAGYRRAKVVICNLQYQGLDFNCAEMPASPAEPQEKTKDNAYMPPESEQQEDAQPEETKVNYERLAFEWLEDYLYSLMEQCNDAQAKKADHLLIPSDDLPMKESWADILKLLLEHGFTLAMETDAGIKVNLPQ